MKKIFVQTMAIAAAAVVCAVVFMCSPNGKEPYRLKELVSVYGTPEFGENHSLPVEIFRTDSGWYAHYITQSGKHLADMPLKLRLGNDTSSVFFDEQGDGPTGFYTLSFSDMGGLFYTSSKGEDFHFFPHFYINKKPASDVAKAVERLAKLGPDEFRATEHIADSLRHLIKYSPTTLKYPFDTIDSPDFRLETQTSADGKFRIYQMRYYLGGNGRGNWPEYIVAQCDMGNEVLFIDNFSYDDYFCDSYNFPHLSIAMLGMMADDSNTLYITETTIYDEYCESATQKVIRAYAIENGGMVKKSVFKTSSKLLNEIRLKYIDEERMSLDTTLFRYVPENKTVLVPLLTSDTLGTFGQYIVYQWDGKRFLHKGTLPLSNYNQK